MKSCPGENLIQVYPNLRATLDSPLTGGCTKGTEAYQMIRIGDFSKLSRVSVKTLRFYDEMGLLKPIEVDRFTGYRLYEANQLPRLYRILALKDLGFSLEEIGRLLAGDLSTEQM